MLPVKLQMGEVIMNLTEKKAVTTNKLRRVEGLEHLVAEAERHLVVEDF